jgi:hypothetical protein
MGRRRLCLGGSVTFATISKNEIKKTIPLTVTSHRIN